MPPLITRALDFNRLAGVSPTDHAWLRFELDPAARLVSSVYPVVRIWEAHQDAREPETIDIGAGGEQGLVQRRGGSVSIYRLSPAEYACLAALAGGHPLSDALEDAAGIDGEFDLAVALRRWAQLGFIVDFSLADESA